MKEYSAHGRDRLQALIPTRGGSFAYGLVDADGRLIAGELAAPAGAGGWTYLREPESDEADAESSVDVRALVTRLDDGGALVVADEWRGARGPIHALLSAFAWALAATLVLGAIGGVLLSSQALKRIEAMRSAARRSSRATGVGAFLKQAPTTNSIISRAPSI